MGMYFNTVATTEMNEKVNNQFNGGNIDYWKDPARRDLFGRIGQGGAALSSIAGQNGIYPNAGFGSGVGRKWFKWLDDLDSTTAIRKHFFDNLDPAGKCLEIVFVVGPKATMPIAVKAQRIPDTGAPYTLRVNIDTPTAAAVRAAIKKQMRTRKRARKKAKT
jgi:hypothetical protein